MGLVTFMGGLFAVICGGLALGHSAVVGRVTLLDFALLAVGGMYGIGWVLVLHVTLAGDNPVWAPWIIPFESLYLLHSIGAFLLLFGMLGGWYLMAHGWHVRSLPMMDGNGVGPQRWLAAFWLLLVGAVVAQGLYAHAYGGFLGQLEYSAAIRSALFDEVPHNPLSFLRPFGGLAMIAAFGFFGLRLSGYRTWSSCLGLVLSFAFSLYVLYSWLGRMGFMVFLATFPLGWGLNKSRSPVGLLLGSGVVFIGLVVGAYGVSVGLNLKSADSLLEFLARELAFPFGSFFAQLDCGEHLFRAGVDFLLTPLYLLPSSWWTSWFEPLGQTNTAVIMGASKGMAGVTGAIPVDLLTVGLMQFHMVGIALVGLLFGALLRIVHGVLSRIPLPGVRAVFEASMALTLAVLGVFYAQPDLVVSGHIHWIAAALVCIGVFRLPRLGMARGGMVADRESAS